MLCFHAIYFIKKKNNTYFSPKQSTQIVIVIKRKTNFSRATVSQLSALHKEIGKCSISFPYTMPIAA